MRVTGIEGRRRRALIASAALLAAAVPSSHVFAAARYWDPNAATAGRAEGGGTWDTVVTNPVWNTASAGTGTQTRWTTQEAFFGGAPDGGTAGVVSLATTSVSANAITINPASDGSLYTIQTGGGFGLSIGAGGITANESATFLQPNGSISLSAAQAWTIAAGKTLTMGDAAAAAPLFQIANSLNVSGGSINFSAANTVYALRVATGMTLTLDNTAATATARTSDNVALLLQAGNYVQNAGATLRLGTTGSGLLGMQNTGSSVTLNGGTLTTGGFILFGTVGTRNITLNGGTVRAGADNAGNFLASDNTFVRAGGAILDTNGFAVTVTQNLLEDPASTGGGLTKNGAGKLTLSGANTYTGATNVNGGTLSLTNVGALGTSSGVTVASGAALEIAVGIGLPAAPLNLNGSGVAGTGALRNTVSTTYAGNVTLGSDATVAAAANTLILSGSVDTAGKVLTVAGANSAFISGPLLGSGTLNKTSTALLNLGGDNSGYTGNINVAANTLRLSVPNAAVNSTVDVAAGASVQLTSTATPDRNVAGLTGTGGLDLFDANLVVGGTGASTSYGGVISDSRVNGSPAGAIHNSVTKAGAGTFTLTGISTYVGDTIISGGTLALADDAGLKFLIGASGVNNAIAGTGAATLAGDFAFDLSGASTTPGATWAIVAPSVAETFLPSFSVTGFNDAGLDTWTLDANGGRYTFDEGTGTLSYALVPEPTTFAALGAAAVALLGRRRRA